MHLSVSGSQDHEAPRGWKWIWGGLPAKVASFPVNFISSSTLNDGWKVNASTSQSMTGSGQAKISDRGCLTLLWMTIPCKTCFLGNLKSESVTELGFRGGLSCYFFFFFSVLFGKGYAIGLVIPTSELSSALLNGNLTSMGFALPYQQENYYRIFTINYFIRTMHLHPVLMK